MICWGGHSNSVNTGNRLKIVPSAKCQLCERAEETLEHFLIDCPTLSPTRDDLLQLWTIIYRAICNRYILVYNANNIVDVMVDSSVLYIKNAEIDPAQLLELEHQSRRLCYMLHTKRYKILSSCSP